MPFIFDFCFGFVSKETWPLKKRYLIYPLFYKTGGGGEEGWAERVLFNLVAVVELCFWAVWQTGLFQGTVASVMHRHCLPFCSPCCLSPLKLAGVTDDKFPALLALQSFGNSWEKIAERREQRCGVCGLTSWLAAQFGSSGFNPAWVHNQARKRMTVPVVISSLWML